MNRHQRRTARAKQIDKTLDRVVAIHEAGHAVARVLSADDFGRPAEKMISSIDVGNGQDVRNSIFDKSITMVLQAITYGPTLSAELQAVFERTVAGVDPSKRTQQHIIEAVKLARVEGVDITPWLRARMLITTLGSVAEARYTGRSIHDVWNSPESEGDQKGAVEEGLWAGLTVAQIRTYIDDALDRSEILVAQENVQRALHALADALPVSGTLKGQRAVFIITQALEGP